MEFLRKYSSVSLEQAAKSLKEEMLFTLRNTIKTPILGGVCVCVCVCVCVYDEKKKTFSLSENNRFACVRTAALAAAARPRPPRPSPTPWREAPPCLSWRRSRARSAPCLFRRALQVRLNVELWDVIIFWVFEKKWSIKLIFVSQPFKLQHTQLLRLQVQLLLLAPIRWV